MSFAYDLLNSLSTPNVDNTTLVIDHFARAIIIPDGIKNLGVENDNDVLRLNFRMPRYLGAVDLNDLEIYINYINAQGVDYTYKVTDSNITDDDNITFSWLVGSTATTYAGIVEFNVSLTVPESRNEDEPVYGTSNAKLPVLKGLKMSKRIV